MASGTWSFEDTVIATEQRIVVKGAASSRTGTNAAGTAAGGSRTPGSSITITSWPRTRRVEARCRKPARLARTFRWARATFAWGQVLMAANTPVLLRGAMVDGSPDLGLMSSGQVAGLIDDLPSCQELIEAIVTEAERRLDRLAAVRPA